MPGAAPQSRESDLPVQHPLHSKECEHAVLGGLLLEPSRLAEVSSQLRPGDFFDPNNKAIYKAMLALTLANALLEKLGGDSLEEIRPRFDALRRNRTTDLPMDQQPWRFGYSP